MIYAMACGANDAARFRQLKRCVLAMIALHGSILLPDAEGAGLRMAAELVAEGLIYDVEEPGGVTRLVITRAGADEIGKAGAHR
ncbi:MAG: hypothetical protein ACREQE_05980 [Candidatus Binataceae bacterium]